MGATDYRMSKFGLEDISINLALSAIYRFTDMVFKFVQWALVLAALKFALIVSGSSFIFYLFWVMAGIYVVALMLFASVLTQSLLEFLFRRLLPSKFYITGVFIAEISVAFGMGIFGYWVILDQFTVMVDALMRIYTRNVS